MSVRDRIDDVLNIIRSDRDPREDPDGAAGRLLLVAVGALMIQAAFRLWAVLEPLSIIGTATVLLVGAVGWQFAMFAALDIDLQKHGHRLAYAVLVVLGLAVFTSLIAAGLFQQFPTDSLLYTAYSADLILQGINPYTATMEGAFAWGGTAHAFATPRIDGTVVTSYSYPVGAALALAPAVASPVPVRGLVVLVAVALGAVIVHASPAKLALAAPMALMAGRNMVITAGGGVWDVLWALPFVLALRWVHHEEHARGGLALGLACAIKQLPWMAAPFIAVRQWRLGNRRGAVVGTGAAVAVFGLINAPWIVAGPVAWVRGVIAPLGVGAPLVHQGLGLTLLTFSGLYALPTWWHGLALVVAATVALTVTAAYPERVGYAVWLAPPFLLWFHYRSLVSYFIVFLPVAVLAVLATNDRVRDAPLPWPTRDRAPAPAEVVPDD